MHKEFKSTRLFISHASEDKTTFVGSLADALVNAGFMVWYDEFSLNLGDSLKTCIDEGLFKCDFGIVVLSNYFFSKHWPREELDGLAAVESSRHRKVILPVWHNITLDEISKFSPTLAGKVGVKSSIGLKEIVAMITRSINNSRRFMRREDFDEEIIHVPSLALNIQQDRGMRIVKKPEVSWEDFGKELLKELRRLDKEKKYS